MALSQNEKILAKYLKNKIIFSEKHLEYLEKIIDINEFGMIIHTNGGKITIIPREEDVYINQYQEIVLDDIIKNFVPSGRFYKNKNGEDTNIQLFTNNKSSFSLNINNGKLEFVEDSMIKNYLSDKDVKSLELSKEIIEKIEKYQFSIDNTFKDFKSSEFSTSKKDLLKLVRNECATIKAKIDYKENEDKKFIILYEQSKYPVIESFYLNLKKNMNENELKEEKKLFENIYNHEIAEVRLDTKERQEDSDNIRKEQIKILEANRKDLTDLKKLQGKTLFFKDKNDESNDKIISLLHIDENGYVYSLDSLVTVNSFLDQYYKNFFAFEDEFSQKDFVGKVYEYKDEDEDIVDKKFVNLYKNNQISVLLDVNSNNLLTIDNKLLSQYYEEIPKDENTQHIISEFSDFNKFIAFVDGLAKKNLNKNIIRENLLHTMVNKAMQTQGLGFYSNLKSDFEKELINEIFNNFSDEFLKNNFTQEEIFQFFDELNTNFISFRNDYLSKQSLNKKMLILSREKNIEKAVAKALDNFKIKKEDNNFEKE